MEVQLQALVDGKKIIVTKASIRSDLQLNDEMKQRSRKPKRKDTEVPQPSGPTTNVADKAVYKERDDRCIQTREEKFMALIKSRDTMVNELSENEVTLAQALAALKSAKVQEKANVVEEPKEQETTSTVSSQQPSQVKIQDKGKAKMIEPEPVKKLIEREKAETNIALKETWDGIQAKIEADCLLAERLQAREQEELTIEERAILFQQLLRRKKETHAVKKIRRERNRSHNKSVNKGVSSCRLLEQESNKKQKVDEDKETTELKSLMEVIPVKDEVQFDAIPLLLNLPSIVDGSSTKKEKKLLLDNQV
ncbi:hypothetical protein Tco_1003677 [Tanacetum coccineum]|uniref:Uncharacterized protein n=1 Tax=Tanacetum coccineum TaxID=301880 RepID=A0ABQ5FAR1_9ASTR